LALRSAMTVQFWLFYWKLERERAHLARVLPESFTRVGCVVPAMSKVIPIRTKHVDLLSNEQIKSSDVLEMPLRALIGRMRYLVVNFGSST
jgi:hypothetical protein